MDKNKLMSMTKAQLVDKLIEQQHLAEAVEAKDNEILAIKNQYAANLKGLQKQVDEAKAATNTDVNTALDKLRAEHKQEIDRLVKQHSAEMQNLQYDYDMLRKGFDSVANSHNDTLARYEAFLKVIQGATDSNVELHNISKATFESHFAKPQKDVK